MSFYKKLMIESQIRGDLAENRFESLASQRGFAIVRHSDYNSQVRDHIDFTITDALNRSAKIDVKAQKKTSRSDNATDSSIIWLEHKNVRGADGWLHGKADFIAFEFADGFRLINRKKLVGWVDKNIDFSSIVSRSSDAYKKVYTRKGRSDLISFVKFSDIEHLVSAVFSS